MEWLDEPTPSTFRQPQISFSARIPNSIPLWDASTMSHHIRLYSPHCFLDLKSVLQSSVATFTSAGAGNSSNAGALLSAVLGEQQQQQQQQQQQPSASAISLAHKSQQQHYQSQQPLFGTATGASSTLCMITKHNNGSLNLWNLFFAEQRGGGGGTGSGSGPTSSSASAPFTQVLSLAHSRRVCGHRFRVNDVSCHPILPLLLTTSHHNSPAGGTASAKAGTTQQLEPSGSSSSNLISGHRSSSVPNSGFCSELILWKVDSVGPLLKSGGVTELARINSLESTAFANVAWVPTLLPSTALGAIAGGHSSASACFVASDGRQLRIYQAVIDARSLLAEAQRYMLNTNDQRRFYYDSSEEEEEEEEESDYESEDEEDLEDGRHHRHHQHHPRRHHSHHSQSSHHHHHQHNRRGLAQPDQDAFRSLFKIVSLQSTARPGAVLELSPIVDARQDWAKTQLLHVFQEQLILGNQMVKPAAASGSKSGSSQKDAGGGAGIAPEISLPDGGPVIDLCHGLFEEVFYLVVVEKTAAAAAAAAGDTRSTLHMWRLVISSRGKASLDDIRSGTSQAASWISAAGGAEDGGGESSRSVSPEFAGGGSDGQNHQPNNGSSSSPLLRIKTRKVTTQVLPLPADVEVIHAAPAAGHLPSSNIYPACYAPFLLTTACSDNKVRFWRCQVTEGGTAEQTNSSSSFTWLEWEMHLKATKPKETTTNNNKTSMDLGAEPIQPEMSSALELPGSPLYVACAYSGRIAVAFKYGHSYTAAARGDGNKRFINIGIAVYECQSSGGSDWILEDTIKVERIPLLEQTDVVDGDVAAEEDLIASQNVAYDLGPLVDKTLKNQQASLSLTTKIASSGASPSNPFLSANSDHQQHHSSASFEGALEEGSGGGGSSNHRVANIQRLLAVPSYTTIQSLRRLIAEQGNQPGSFTQKSPVLLDWVSTEDGSHLLTASAGHKVALFAPVTQRKSVAAVAATATTTEANRQAAAPRTSTTSSTTSTLIPQQSFGGPGGGGGGGGSTSSPSSFTRQTSQLLYNHSSAAGGPGGSHISVTRWMVLRVAELASVDGLPPLPMQLSWVRDGILVVGMDNEMLIYTQWKRAGPPALVGGSAQSSAAAAEKTATSNSRQQQRPLATTAAAAAIRRYPFDSVDLPAERFVATSSSAGAKDATEATSNEKNNIISSGEHQPDDYGLFEAFRLSSPVIPQYHPRQLMELLAFGKIHRVRAILSHLVASLCSIGGSKEGYNSYNPANMGGPHGGGSSFENDARSPRAWTRTRALSIAQQPSPHESGGGTGGGGAGGSSVSPGLDGHTNPIVAEEIQLDYTEIASIRPLPLYALLQADEGVSAERTKAMEEAKAKAKQAANKVAGGRGAALGSSSAFTLDGAEALDADALFEDLYSYKTQVEETLDEFLGNRTAFNFSNLATSKFLKSGGGGGDGAAASANAAAAAAGDAYYEGELHISIHFDQRQAALLSKLLTHSHLPGLSSLDQMHLLALADSLASFSDLADKSGGGGGANAGDSLSSTPATAEPSYHPTEDGLLTISANSLDDCGLRYLLNMRQHVYLLRCLPLMQRKALQAAGLGLHNIIWAFHSETQEELVQLVTMPANPTAAAAGGANPALKSITWAELREVGVGYWVRNNALLRKVIERLAKAAFKARNDPLDAALYYMAMRKKNLVWGLYRSVQDRKMTDFFSHDFGEDKWRKAALKNAYALMGKQRFEHAVAFFLLAGSLWDAVEVCLNRLDDLQLAMVIVRLYDGGDIETVPETLKRMLQEEILGYRQGGTVQDRQLAHPDPFLRSMAYWMLHEYNLALSTLLEVGDVGSRHPKTVEAMNSSNSGGGGGGGGGRSTYATPQPPPTSTGNAEEDGSVGSNFEGLHPAVFNFYLYLRTQPLIVRRAQVAQHNIGTTVGSSTAAAAGALGAGAKKFTRSTSTAKNEPAPQSKKSHLFSGATNRADAIAITAFERRLFFLTAHRHLRAGCPALALEVLSRLPANILSYSEKSELEECSRRMSLPEAALRLADDGHLPQAAKLAVATPSKAEDLFSGGGGGGGGGGFDWGAPTSSLFEPTTSSLFAPTEEEEFKITFDDDEKSEDDEDEDEGGLQMKAPEKAAESSEAPAADSSSKDQQQQTKIDVMAQQFKFIACLKILMEELSTLATGFEVDGGQLRYQLYIWLERSVTILKETVNYHTFSLRSSSSEGGGGGRTGSIDHSSAGGLVPLSPPKSSSGGSVLVNATTTTTSAANRSSLSRKHSDNPHHHQQQEAAHQQLPPTAHPQPPLPSLHDILLADKADFESKMERCRRRKSWLLANEALLRNLLSYCSLHGAHGGGLASVRMELILLLQELQQDRTPQQQLLSPLPLPTTLPLLTASVASQKTVVADPIRYLQSTIHDILGSLAEIATYVHMPTRSEYSSGSGGGSGSLAPVRELLALPPFMVSGTATALTAWAVSFQQQQQGQGQSNLQPNSSNVQEQQQQHSYASSLYSLVHILRDLGISLSSCVYQSLCDCDTVMQNVAGGGGGGGGRTSKSSSRPASRPPPPQHQQLTVTRSTGGGGSNPSGEQLPGGAATSSASSELLINGGVGLGSSTSSNEPLVATSPPSKWPGVQSLQALIVREKDEDLPKLHTLLCEAYVAVYLSQLVYALTICDAGILFRLVGLRFTERSWADLFGGGVKRLLCYVSAASVGGPSGLAGGGGAVPAGGAPVSPNDLLNGGAGGAGGAAHNDLLNTLSKQRMKLHMKILEQLNQASGAMQAAGAAAVDVVSAVSTGMVNVATSPSSTFTSLGNQFGGGGGGGAVPGSAASSSSAAATVPATAEQRPTYRETFVPPAVSLVNYLMSKPELADELRHLDYDSNASEGEGGGEEGEDFEDGGIGGKFRSELAAKSGGEKKDDDDEPDDEEYDNWANEGGGSGGASKKKSKQDLAAEKRKANLEYDLYAWCIIRLAVARLAYEQLDRFLTVSGLEKGDLPTTSPAIHAMLKTLKRWQYSLAFYMNEFTHLPDRFLPNMYVDGEKTSGPVIAKYKSLLETNNTPFRGGGGGSGSSSCSLKANKRLWNYLVRQRSVQDVFIRYIYAKAKAAKLARDHGATAICNSLSGSALNESAGGGGGSSEGGNSASDQRTMQPGSDREDAQQNQQQNQQQQQPELATFGGPMGRRMPEPLRIVHKDQDQITAFCLNRSSSPGLLAISTQKEIQELNIRPLLDACVPWLEEDTEMDILNLRQK